MDIFSKYLKHFQFKYLIQLFFLSIVLVAMYFGFSKLGEFLQSDAVKQAIASTGNWGLFIFFFTYTLTLVVAPLTGFPLLIAAVGAFGLFEAVLFNYFISLLGATINFAIARLWGRRFIQIFVGKKGLSKVDALAANFGTDALILSRLFQGFLFEWISYAAGLTKMPFRSYFLITAICSLLYNILILLSGLVFEDLGQLFISLTLINYLLMTVPFFYYLVIKLVKHMKN